MKGFIEATIYPDGRKAIIPIDNINYIADEDGHAKVYLSKGIFQYVTLRQSVDQISALISEASK